MNSLVFLDQALKLGRYLVIADLHIGASIRATRFDTKIKQKILQHEINALLSLIPRNLGDKLIILGDIKDWLGLPPKYAQKKILFLLDHLSETFEKIFIVRGNHDGRLIEILDYSPAKNIYLTDHMTIKLGDRKILLTHGHIKPDPRDIRESSIIVMGHIHPTSPTKKRILLGTLRIDDMEKLFIILPALNPRIDGIEPTMDVLFRAFTRIIPRDRRLTIKI